MADVVSTNQFKTGMAIEIDGQPFTIVDFQHVKPGKGGAFVRTLVRTKAPPLPGLTCWKLTIVNGCPSISMAMPVLNWLVLTTSAMWSYSGVACTGLDGSRP